MNNSLSRFSAMLLANLFFVSARTYVYQEGINCNSQQCGINARCIMVENQPICICTESYTGNPRVACDPIECVNNQDCSERGKFCFENQCKDDCSHLCGPNAICETKNNVIACICHLGYFGDAFRGCTPSNLTACRENVCGAKAVCIAGSNGSGKCECLAGFVGNALEGCHPECRSDDDCPTHLYCSPSTHKCDSPCGKCGPNTICGVARHEARCTCDKNHRGDPRIGCVPEYLSHNDCPGRKALCRNNECVDPCDGACGAYANCDLVNIENVPTAVCSCSVGSSGDPLTECFGVLDN